MPRKKNILTKEEIKKEILKCGRDPVYFINTYCKISHPLKGSIPFRMYKFQEELVEKFQRHRFNIILKARQLGCTTLSAAYAAWLMMFHKDKSILVMATKLEKAANLVKKTKSIVKKLPDFIRISEIKVDNANSFVLDNDSFIKPITKSEDAGRSESLSLLIIDEAALIPDLEVLWAGLYPTLSLGGNCIVLSTPKGAGGWYYKTYTEAEAGINDFVPSSLPWYIHPERDQEWFEKESRQMSEREIAQELLCSFNLSGETVFSSKDIEKIKLIVKDPKYRSGYDRNLWIWKESEPGRTYLLTADVARGDGADYSVIEVFDVGTMIQCAEYQGKPTPEIFANLIFQVGLEYNKAMVVVENNSIGYMVLDKLIERAYPNLYYSTKGNTEFVDQYEAETRSGVVPGFTQTMKTKPLIIAKAEELIRNNMITIYSTRLVNEMMTFVWDGGRPVTVRGFFDDMIIAMAIACWIKDVVLHVNTREIEYQRVFLDCMFKRESKLNTRFDNDSTERYKKQHEENMKLYGWIYTK